MTNKGFDIEEIIKNQGQDIYNPSETAMLVDVKVLAKALRQEILRVIDMEAEAKRKEGNIVAFEVLKEFRKQFEGGGK